tara:strand:+ start:441 stop:614 length:174 start_codon:yes stop_codon:yes gene_type:complete
MVTPTDRAKRMLNLLKKLVKEEHLYTDDKLEEVKSQIKILEEEIAQRKSKVSKGFGK